MKLVEEYKKNDIQYSNNTNTFQKKQHYGIDTIGIYVRKFKIRKIKNITIIKKNNKKEIIKQRFSDTGELLFEWKYKKIKRYTILKIFFNWNNIGIKKIPINQLTKYVKEEAKKTGIDIYDKEFIIIKFDIYKDIKIEKDMKILIDEINENIRIKSYYKKNEKLIDYEKKGSIYLISRSKMWRLYDKKKEQQEKYNNIIGPVKRSEISFKYSSGINSIKNFFKLKDKFLETFLKFFANTNKIKELYKYQMKNILTGYQKTKNDYFYNERDFFEFLKCTLKRVELLNKMIEIYGYKHIKENYNHKNFCYKKRYFNEKFKQLKKIDKIEMDKNIKENSISDNIKIYGFVNLIEKYGNLKLINYNFKIKKNYSQKKIIELYNLYLLTQNQKNKLFLDMIID